MSDRMVSVQHNGTELNTSRMVLKELGLQPNQSVSEADVWRVIQANYAALKATLALRRMTGKHALAMALAAYALLGPLS